ncbi:MAG: hypothetical protein ACR2HF_13890 [Methylococcaceae bacterium]
MIEAVPTQLNEMARAVLSNHPNAYSCQCLRKVLKRPGDQVGGMPTLGGMAVLDSEDEDDYDFDFLGNGYALQAEPFQPSPMTARGDANNSYTDSLPFLIAPEEGSDFTLKKHDLIFLMLLDGQVRLAWEIISIETILNIPPFSLRYIANRRNDLNIVG